MPSSESAFPQDKPASATRGKDLQRGDSPHALMSTYRHVPASATLSCAMTQLLLWATDVHLDHLRARQAAFEFGRSLSREQPGAVGLIVTGDIAEAPSVERTLEDLASGFSRPLYFV